MNNLTLWYIIRRARTEAGKASSSLVSQALEASLSDKSHKSSDSAPSWNNTNVKIINDTFTALDVYGDDLNQKIAIQTRESLRKSETNLPHFGAVNY